MKSFRRNIKAISPIFATLILIAIAVIAGIVVYMFTSGTIASMTGSGTAGQEKVAVQGFSITADPALIVYAQSTNGLLVTPDSIIIKDSTGATVGMATTTGTLPALGTLTKLTGVFAAPAPTIVAGAYYTVTLTTTKGGSFVSAAAPAAAAAP
jgi:flagellin-like protein